MIPRYKTYVNPKLKGAFQMKNYGTPEMLELLREAVNIEASGEAWHHAHMLWAQSMGL